VTSKSAELRDLLRRNAAVFAAQSPERGGFLFKSFETFVLAYRRGYESAALNDDERALAERLVRQYRGLWCFLFAYNRCFENAQRLLHIDDTGTLVYVEGFVWVHGDRLPPVHHGWLSLHGKVIDLTAPTRATPRPPPPEPPQLHGVFEGRAYLGVPFLRSYVKRGSNYDVGWSSLLEDESSGYRLLAVGGDGAVRGRGRA
jgi:hypothetical protein